MHLAQHIETHIHTGDAADTVTLDYEARFLRRKRLVSDGGEPFLVELAETQSLNQGEGFRLDDGRIIAVMRRPSRCLRCGTTIWPASPGMSATGTPPARLPTTIS